MKISATGAKRRSTGFTLVELMVCLVIMALVSSLVVLSLPRGSDPVHSAAGGLAADLRYAARDSVVSGAATGVAVSAEGYRFLRFRRGTWMPLVDGEHLSTRQWPDGVAVSLSRDGETIALGAGPQIRFNTVGMATPFEIDLIGPERRRRIVGTLEGDVALEEADGSEF